MRLTSQEVRIGKMKEEDIKTITDSIKEKLGEESSALIADDLGLLLTKNVEIQKEYNPPRSAGRRQDIRSKTTRLLDHARKGR